MTNIIESERTETKLINKMLEITAEFDQEKVLNEKFMLKNDTFFEEIFQKVPREKFYDVFAEMIELDYQIGWIYLKRLWKEKHNEDLLRIKKLRKSLGEKD